jgi:antitoxin component YwqK of YwqJK toxin-antitoxin module
MKNSIYIFLILVTHLSFSQIITLPHQDTSITYQIIIKSIGDSTKHTETAYFKKDTSKIAWIKYFVDTNQVGVYREYFFNGNTYKKIIYDYHGKKNGIYQEWDENKNLTVSGKYKNDKKQGVWMYFKEKRNEVYKKGVKHGRWRIYEGKEPWSLYVYKKGELVKLNKDQKPLIAR